MRRYYHTRQDFCPNLITPNPSKQRVPRSVQKKVACAAFLRQNSVQSDLSIGRQSNKTTLSQPVLYDEGL